MRALVWALDFGAGTQPVGGAPVLDDRNPLIVSPNYNICPVFGDGDRVDIVIDN